MHTPEVDKLINQLTKPIYVFRMASAGEHQDTAWGKSCRIRAAQARIDVDRIVREYVEDVGP